jgi:molecular chaperone HscA
MLQDSHANAELDARLRARQEQVVEAQRLLESIDSALLTDGDAWLDDTERTSLLAAMTALRETMDGAEAEPIRMAAEALNQLSTPFAARRMDNAVRKAFSGRQISDIAR